MRYVDGKVDISLLGRNMRKWQNNGGRLDGEVEEESWVEGKNPEESEKC